MKFRLFIPLLLFSLLVFSCEKQEDSPILLFLTPSEQYTSAVPGELLHIQVEIKSKVALKELLVTRQLGDKPTQTLLDSTISGTNFIMTFETTVPQVADSASMLLMFEAYDVNDNRMVQPHLVIVKNPGFLVETTGHTIHSRFSNKEDGFNLETRQSLFSYLSDSSLVDLLDAPTDSLTPDILSRSWKSYTGIRFVRFNDFDYANATYSYLTDVFDAGVKKPIITNLQPEDIILARTPFNRYFAIRIVQVIDNDFALEDRYIFNIKEAGK